MIGNKRSIGKNQDNANKNLDLNEDPPTNVPVIPSQESTPAQIVHGGNRSIDKNQSNEIESSDLN